MYYFVVVKFADPWYNIIGDPNVHQVFPEYEDIMAKYHLPYIQYFIPESPKLTILPSKYNLINKTGLVFIGFAQVLLYNGIFDMSLNDRHQKNEQSEPFHNNSNFLLLDLINVI